MFQLTRSYFFEATRRLPFHDGKCANLHEHTFRLSLTIEGEHLTSSVPKTDMLIDYGDISLSVKTLLENYLDGHYLNETTGLDSPTSEALSEWIYWMLEPRILDIRKDGTIKLISVGISETCMTSCTYFPSEVRTTRGKVVNWETIMTRRSPHKQNSVV